MRPIHHPKNIMVLFAILLSASLTVISCNNNSKSKSETEVATEKKDTMPPPVKDSTNMMDDTSKGKGEQTPPPK